MNEQLLLGLAFLVVALVVAYEAVETWRWRGVQNRPVSRFRAIRVFRRGLGGLFSALTLGRASGRNNPSAQDMSAYDLSRRLGDAPDGPVHLQPGRIVVSGPAAAPFATQPVLPVRPERPSRARMVRDTAGAALILGGLVVAFANFLPTQPKGDVLSDTATPAPTARVIIVTAPPSSSPESDASAAPNPSPTQTVLVSSTPTPTPVPTPRPTIRPQPTPAPTVAPAAPPPDAAPDAETDTQADSQADPQPHHDFERRREPGDNLGWRRGQCLVRLHERHKLHDQLRRWGRKSDIHPERFWHESHLLAGLSRPRRGCGGRDRKWAGWVRYRHGEHQCPVGGALPPSPPSSSRA